MSPSDVDSVDSCVSGWLELVSGLVGLQKNAEIPGGRSARGVGVTWRLLQMATQAQLMHFLPAALHSHPCFLPFLPSNVGRKHVDPFQQGQQGFSRRRFSLTFGGGDNDAVPSEGLLLIMVSLCGCGCWCEESSLDVAWLPGPMHRREFLSVLGSTRLLPLELPPQFSALLVITQVMLIGCR